MIQKFCAKPNDLIKRKFNKIKHEKNETVVVRITLLVKKSYSVFSRSYKSERNSFGICDVRRIAAVKYCHYCDHKSNESFM